MNKLTIVKALAVSLPALLLATTVPGFAQGPSTESLEDVVAAIKRLNEELADVWTLGDLGEQIVDDFDFVTSNAMWWRGREELNEGLAVVGPALRAQAIPGAAIRIEKVRFMTPNVAVVHRGGGAREARSLNVFVRQNGRWRMLAQLGTRAAAAPGFELPGIRSLSAEQPTIVSAWSAAGESGESPARDEAAIRDVVAATVKAFNRKDAKAYAAMLVDDADFVTANAYWWRGRDEIERGMGMVFNGPLPADRLTERVEKIRFLATGIALVHTWVEAEGYDLPNFYPSLPVVLGGRTMRIVAKRSNEWRVVAYQGSNAAVPPPERLRRLPGILEPEDGR